MQQCHICKRNILASEMTKHLKTCLSSNKNTGTNGKAEQNNAGEFVDISKNLQNMSIRRPDIFGGEAQSIRKDEEIKPTE